MARGSSGGSAAASPGRRRSSKASADQSRGADHPGGIAPIPEEPASAAAAEASSSPFEHPAAAAADLASPDAAAAGVFSAALASQQPAAGAAPGSPVVGTKRKGATGPGSALKGRRAAKTPRIADALDVASAPADSSSDPPLPSPPLEQQQQQLQPNPQPWQHAQPQSMAASLAPIQVPLHSLPPGQASKAALSPSADPAKKRSGGSAGGPAAEHRKTQKVRKDRPASAAGAPAGGAAEAAPDYDPSDPNKPLPNGLMAWGQHTLTNRWTEIKILERRVRRDFVAPDKKLYPRAPVHLEKKSKWQTKAEAALTTMDEDARQQAVLNAAAGLLGPLPGLLGGAGGLKREGDAGDALPQQLAAWAETAPAFASHAHLLSQDGGGAPTLARQDSDGGGQQSQHPPVPPLQAPADGSGDGTGGDAADAEHYGADHSQHPWDYYVHYPRWDRRMDEWLPRERIRVGIRWKTSLAAANRLPSPSLPRAGGGTGSGDAMEDDPGVTQAGGGGGEDSSGFPSAAVTAQDGSGGGRHRSAGESQPRRAGRGSRVKLGEEGGAAAAADEADVLVSAGADGGGGAADPPPAPPEELSAEALQQGEEEAAAGDHGHHGFSKDDMRAHEEATKLKNISYIGLGRHTIATWYFSPFPEEYDRFDRLYCCEFCLQFFGFEAELLRHSQMCDLRHPPGNEIYRSHDQGVTVAAFEVDGAKEQQYCENLCYIAKLFLDHKTLEYDCSPFLFYVICELDERGYHLVGYFSKEKQSAAKYNLACILTLPCHQRKGYGRLLISLSYELSKIEQQVGSPEKPISDLGKLSYMSFWSQTLVTELYKIACGRAPQPKPFLAGEVADDPQRLRQFEEQAAREQEEACDMQLLQLPGRRPGDSVALDGVSGSGGEDPDSAPASVPVPLRDVLRLSTGEPAVSIDQLSRMTCFTTDDILETLEHLKLLVWYKGAWVFSVTRLVHLYDKMQKAEAGRQQRLKEDPTAINVQPCIPDKLHWTPYHNRPRNKRLLVVH